MGKAAFPLATISPTQVRAYQRCPLAYRYRFIERRRAPPAPASLLGHAVHVAIEALYKAKRRLRRDLELWEFQEVFDQEWEREMPPEGDAARGSPEEFEAAREEGYRILEFYLQSVAPQVRPHLIEHRFKFDPPGLGATVAGQVDLIDQDGTVVDHKTSTQPYPDDYLDRDVQLFCYALGYAIFREGIRLRPGTLPPAVRLPAARVDVILKGPEPQLQQIKKQYSEEDVARIFGILREVAENIRAGDFRPFWQIEGRQATWTTCTSCEFYHGCDQRLEAPEADADN